MIGYPKDEGWEIMLQVLTVSLDPMIVAWISALQELNDVCSCQSAFQQIGRPERITIMLLILLNLNRGNWIPSQTALPKWEPPSTHHCRSSNNDADEVKAAVHWCRLPCWWTEERT